MKTIIAAHVAVATIAAVAAPASASPWTQFGAVSGAEGR